MKLKVKSKVSQKILQSSELSDIFNQILGLKEGDYGIVLEHSKQVKICLNIIITHLNNLTTGSLKNFESCNKELEQIKKYIKTIGEELKALDMLYENDKSKLTEAYMAFKRKPCIQVLHRLLKSMEPYHMQMETKGGNFVLDNYDQSCKPIIEISDFDLYPIWDSIPKVGREDIMHKFKQIYKYLKQTVKILKKPDVDIHEVSKTFIVAIDSVRGQIPRCNEAFDIIASKVHLLAENFGDYYENFVETGNSSIFFQEFIMDVAKDQKKNKKINTKLIFQFKQIVAHFLKVPNQGVSNPAIKDALKMLQGEL